MDEDFDFTGGLNRAAFPAGFVFGDDLETFGVTTELRATVSPRGSLTSSVRPHHSILVLVLLYTTIVVYTGDPILIRDAQLFEHRASTAEAAGDATNSNDGPLEDIDSMPPPPSLSMTSCLHDAEEEGGSQVVFLSLPAEATLTANSCDGGKHNSAFWTPIRLERQVEEPCDPSYLQEIFHTMSAEGLTNYAIKMFDALCKDGLTHEALQLFALIKDKGTMPDAVTHTTVLKARMAGDCQHLGATRKHPVLRQYHRNVRGKVEVSAGSEAQVHARVQQFFHCACPKEEGSTDEWIQGNDLFEKPKFTEPKRWHR